MAASSSPVKEGPRQLEVYIYWAESSGWVFVPRPSEKPERDPGLRVEAPAYEPPAGTHGRYLLLDWRALDPALDDAFRAPGSASGGGGARSAAAAVRRQDGRLRGLLATVRQLEEKLRLRQEAGTAGPRREPERALRAEVKELKAMLEGERSRADVEKRRADQIQAELHCLEQAAHETQLAGARFATKLQERADATPELESQKVEDATQSRDSSVFRDQFRQLEAPLQSVLENPARPLQDLPQHVEEQQCRADERAPPEQDQAASETERRRSMGRAVADSALLGAEQGHPAAELQRRLGQAEEWPVEERDPLVSVHEALQQEGERLATEQEAQSVGHERQAAEGGKVDEQAMRLNQERQPENLLRLLLDGFAASCPESKIQCSEEHLVEDAKQSRDSSVFRDQFRLLEAALAQKPDGQRHESGVLHGAAEPADSLSCASKGIVGALLAIQGLQEAGEKKLVAELQEQLGFRTSKAMNLGAAGMHGKARSHEEKSAQRREIPLAFALALVSVYCLLASSARRRMQGTVSSIRKEVQEVRQLLPSQERDLESLEARLRAVFRAHGAAAASERARAELLADQRSLVEAVEELRRRFRAYAKSDCIGKIVDVSSRCYQAWETFEKHLLWSRRFAQLRRHGAPAPGDLRALLFASLLDPDDEGAGLPRELAALVQQAACQRQAGLAGPRSGAAGEAGAAAAPAQSPLKRARRAASSASSAPAASSGGAHDPAGSRVEAAEEHSTMPRSLM